MSNTRKASPPQKHHIRLHVIPEPAEGTRSVLIFAGEGTVAIKGDVAPNLVMDCGSCGAPLVQGVPVSQIESVVFKCNGCGAFNETVEG